MRSQESREDQTVVIGVALGTFAAVMVVAMVGLALATALLELPDRVAGWWTGAAAVAAAALAVASIVRSEKR